MRTRTIRLLAVAGVGLALFASACSADSADKAERVFPPFDTEPTVQPTPERAAPLTQNEPTTEPRSVAPAPAAEQPEPDPAANGAIDLVAVTIEEFGIATMAPRGWIEVDSGVFEGGSGQLALGAIPSWAAQDFTDFGLVALDTVEAAGREWQIQGLETADMMLFLATTDSDDVRYFVQLVAPPALAPGYTDSIGTPVLENFTVVDPDAMSGQPTLGTVTIGDRAVAYASGGSGTSTVVFESGHGDGMAVWAAVLSEVAEFTNVFAYDRPGYGRSDIAETTRDGETMVAELRELLRTTGHEPPYVLVGHSLGGTVMDLFARTHPDEVSGLVLVDSRHHEFTNRCLTELDDPSECVAPEEMIAAAPAHVRDEWRSFGSTEQQVTSAPGHDRALALTVIVAGLADQEGSPDGWQLWQQAQRDYASMVPDSTLVVADGSDHQIPSRQPEVIVDAIAETLGIARADGAADAIADGAELQDIVDELVADTTLPAVGITVFDDAQVVETVVAGVRRAGDPTGVELTDKFSIGSNAKAMTAALVAIYVDERLISWDTTAGDVFGDRLPAIHRDFEDVSFRQLLSHTAGINDDSDASWVVPLLGSGRSVVEQRRAVAEIALARPEDHEPGTYLYSNVGYTIVGSMLEELTGSSWETLMQTRLFDALNMASCGFGAPGTPGTVDQPWGHYDQQGGEAIDPGDDDADYPAALGPAGLVHCNMADWTRFLQSQLRGFRGGASEMISPEAFTVLQTAPTGSDYALGWVLKDAPNGHLTLWHNGSNDRFTAEVWLVPEENWGLLMVTNLGETMANPTLFNAGQAIFAARPSR